MKAVVYETFAGPVGIQTVDDPTPSEHGVVLKVQATGLCRSDWHGWMGHDADIRLPHIPGHELSGIVEAVGTQVSKWKTGDRVTLPFVCGCGTCEQCISGNHQVCDHQFQPGFTHWGSFAEYVAIDYADTNLVLLPETIEFETAASLGCRFATAFRALVFQAKLQAGTYVAVHGCGGVGLSAIMIARAIGAYPIAIDIKQENLSLAKTLGAVATIQALDCENVIDQIKTISKGGVHVSIDALGSPQTCFNSIACLRKRGIHVQVGLLLAEHANTPVPFDRIVANELEILGSHGMQAHCYDQMLAMIVSGQLQPDKLIGKKINLQHAPQALMNMNNFTSVGATVINRF